MASKNNISILEQIEIYLSEKYDFRGNTILNEVEYKLKEEEKWTTANISDLFRELAKKHYKVSNLLLTNILTSSFIKDYNMIKEYFENLPEWNPNGIDYIDILSNYVGVLPFDRQRFKTQFKKMLVRTVACALGDGVNKQVFTFIGQKQNTGKTTFWRWIVPKELKDGYKENLEFDGKDNERAFGSNFIINLDELASLSKENINKLKTSISKDVVNIRLPYAKNTSRIKRICSFVASTNETEFLTDLTGNVRWVCFKINGIDWNYSKDIEINNVWAQAYALYRNKYDFNLTDKEIQENEQSNSLFMAPIPEMEYLPLFFEPSNFKENDALFLQTTEILAKLQIRTDNKIKFNTKKLGQSLSKYGFNVSQYKPQGKVYQIKGYWVKEINHRTESLINPK